MPSLHIENTVRDYDQWKAAFDRFERTRAEQGVRSYRVSRRADDPNRVVVDLDFDSLADATRFRELLFKIWRTPQSLAQLTNHADPVIYEVMEQRALGAAVV